MCNIISTTDPRLQIRDTSAPRNRLIRASCSEVLVLCDVKPPFHALTDDIGRPLAFLITPGNTHDLVGARDLIGMIRSPRRLLADRAYDARSLRDELAARRIKAVIPPNPTRKHPHRYDKTAYKGRNVIERMFCRLGGLPAARNSI